MALAESGDGSIAGQSYTLECAVSNADSLSDVYGVPYVSKSVICSRYRIRVKFGGDKKLTVWRSDLEPPIIMSANYFNLGGGADHSSW